MSEWRARLVDLLIRRYSDAQALRHAAQLRLGDELASELPGGASLKVLATEVVLACQRRGTVETLLLCLRSEAGASDPELDALCDEHVVAHAGPQLQAAIAAHCEHARLIARRPRVDALVHTLMDAPALDLERVFVAPRVRTIDSPAESMQWRERTEPGGIARPSAARPLLAVWPEPSAWLLVLGGPGAGKSTLARWLTLTQAAGRDDVPVRIELQQYAAWQTKRPAAGFLEYLDEAQGPEAALSGIQLRSLALAGRVLWLFDGLDEITDADARFECARRIAGLRRHGGRAVIMSRPLGLDREIALLRDAGTATCALEPFDAPQLRELGTKWRDAGLIEDVALRRFAAQLAASSQLRELARSPLIAAFMLVLARHDDLPLQRCRLLAEIGALVVGRWAEQRRPSGYVLDRDGRMKFLCELAWKMRTELEHGLGNIVEKRQLLRSAAQFFQRTTGATRDAAEERARQLVDELGVQIHALAWFGGNNFGFSHRSLLEFFAADALIDRSPDEVVACFADQWWQGAWAEVLAMAAGLLAERDPQLALRALRAVFAGIEPFDAPRLLSASEFTVRCLAEIESLDSPALREWCEQLTRLWIELGWIAGLDLRELARSLRAVGPRWPGAAILHEWLRTSRGVGPVSGTTELSTGFSGGGVRQSDAVRLAVTVSARDQRLELLELLSDPSSVLVRFADDLAALGPWTEEERDVLAGTLLQNGDDWDHDVLEWLGDLRETRVERALLNALETPGLAPRQATRCAVLLLRSSTHWRLACTTLNRLLLALEITPDFPTRLARVLERMDDERRRAISRKMTQAQAPELRAAGHLILAEDGSEASAAELVAMLLDPSPRVQLSACWALAHGRFPGAHQRVMDILGEDVTLVTLVWAISALAHTADERGPSARALAWWRHLADDGNWSPSMRWVAVGALLRRPTWREQGLDRLRRLQLERPGNSPDIDHALRILAEQPDGRAALELLLRDETDPLRRRWMARVLLERFPGHARARAELREQAAGSTHRDEQHQLAHLMRRLGLPREDWEGAARNIVTHVADPIARCVAAGLLGDRPAMDALSREAHASFAGLIEHAGTLLRCDDLRRALAGLPPIRSLP